MRHALLMLLDAGLTRLRRAPEIVLQAPGSLAVGAGGEAKVGVLFTNIFTPRRVEMMLEGNELIAVEPRRATVEVSDKKTAAAYQVTVGFQLTPAELQINRARIGR